MKSGENYIIQTALKRYMLPTILSTVSISFCQLVDAVMMGQILGETGLAAGCLVFPITALINFFNGLLGGGGATRFSLAVSRGNRQEGETIFSTCIAAVIFVGLILALFAAVFMPQIAHLLGARGDTVQPTMAYGRILLIGAPAILLCSSMQHFLRNDNAPRRAMIGVLIMNIINILFDYIFMAVMGMGVAGAAYAMLLGCLCTLAYFAVSHKTLHLGKIDLSEIAPSAKTGMGGSIAFLTAIIVQITCNTLLVSLGGANGAAMNSVVNNINFLIQSIFLGVAMATQPIISTFYGEEDDDGLRRTIYRAIGITVGLSIIMCLMQFLFAKHLAALFGMVGNANAPAAEALRIMSLASLTLGFTLVMMFYYQATEKPGISSVLALSRVFVFLLPMMILLSRSFGISGIWWGRALADVLCVVLCLALGCIAAGKNKVPVLLIPKRLPPEEYRTMMRNDVSELPAVHSALEAFCLDKGLSERKRMHVLLVIEEMVTNICAHGFQPGTKHYIDVRVGFDGENAVIRIRDDGVLFNPLDYIEKHEDPENQRLGILILRNISKTLKYDRIMSFNNLIIKI